MESLCPKWLIDSDWNINYKFAYFKTFVQYITM